MHASRYWSGWETNGISWAVWMGKRCVRGGRAKDKRDSDGTRDVGVSSHPVWLITLPMAIEGFEGFEAIEDAVVLLQVAIQIHPGRSCRPWKRHGRYGMEMEMGMGDWEMAPRPQSAHWAWRRREARGVLSQQQETLLHKLHNISLHLTKQKLQNIPHPTTRHAAVTNSPKRSGIDGASEPGMAPWGLVLYHGILDELPSFLPPAVSPPVHGQRLKGFEDSQNDNHTRR